MPPSLYPSSRRLSRSRSLASIPTSPPRSRANINPPPPGIPPPAPPSPSQPHVQSPSLPPHALACHAPFPRPLLPFLPLLSLLPLPLLPAHPAPHLHQHPLRNHSQKPLPQSHLPRRPPPPPPHPPARISQRGSAEPSCGLPQIRPPPGQVPLPRSRR
ncbi:unnamed protein product [Closterium sp. NIES-54]